MLKKIAAPLGLIVLLAGGLAAFVVQGGPVTVTVARPADGVAAPVFGLGTVEARVASDVAFAASGTLLELSADEGDRIAAGAVMARLDTTAQAARLARAEALKRETEAALGQAQARLERAQAVQAQKRSTNARRQSLARKGTVSPEAAEEAAAEAAVAAADVAVAESDRAAAAAGVDAAAAQVAVERRVLDDMILRAPYDALVVGRRRELGGVVGSGTTVFALADPASVWVRAYVDESLAGAVRLGQPAEITLRSRPAETLRGRVARIGIENDRVSEERVVYVAFDAIPEPFHLGEQAEVLITAEPQALVVPAPAVSAVHGASATVWVVADGSLRRREVRLGRRFADGRIEVLAGLGPHEQVVTGASAELREGRPAQAGPDAPT